MRMLAYNGSIPGPTLRKSPKARRSPCTSRNDADTEATVHWHGLRLDNKFDGDTHETQEPIRDRWRLHLPGSLPRPRGSTGTTCTAEDYGLDMGLYGNLVVVPRRGGLLATCEPRRSYVTLDDVLIEDGQMAGVQPCRPELRGDGALRQRDAHRRARRPRSLKRGPARSCASTSQTRPTRGSSTSPCRGPA